MIASGWDPSAEEAEPMVYLLELPKLVLVYVAQLKVFFLTNR
jgi:hypothetical protein